jgi:hypothetical protein
MTDNPFIHPDVPHETAEQMISAAQEHMITAAALVAAAHVDDIEEFTLDVQTVDGVTVTMIVDLRGFSNPVEEDEDAQVVDFYRGLGFDVRPDGTIGSNTEAVKNLVNLLIDEGYPEMAAEFLQELSEDEDDVDYDAYVLEDEDEDFDDGDEAVDVFFDGFGRAADDDPWNDFVDGLFSIPMGPPAGSGWSPPLRSPY